MNNEKISMNGTFNEWLVDEDGNAECPCCDFEVHEDVWSGKPMISNFCPDCGLLLMCGKQPVIGRIYTEVEKAKYLRKIEKSIEEGRKGNVIIKTLEELEAMERDKAPESGWLRVCRINCKLCGASLEHEFQSKYDPSNVQLTCDCGAITVELNPWGSRISGATGVHLEDDCEEFYDYWDTDSSNE